MKKENRKTKRKREQKQNANIYTREQIEEKKNTSRKPNWRAIRTKKKQNNQNMAPFR